MPLMPERVKYRKMHRGNRAGLATRGQTVAFGEYGLMALERCWLDTKQIEAARVAIARNMKRHGKMWIRIFPQKSFTKKPLETRMGKGKGPLESWVAVIRPANVLFEVDGVTEAVARESLRLAATKLPIKTKFISRHRMAAESTADLVMKKTQRKEIQEKTLAELLADSRNWRQEIFNLRLQQASAQLEKPARLRTLRRDIARIETRISQLRKKGGIDFLYG